MRQGAAPGEARGGWLAKPGDLDDFAAKLLWVMNDPAAREAKVAEARAMAGEYRAEEIAKTLAGYYEEILRAEQGRDAAGA